MPTEQIDASPWKAVDNVGLVQPRDYHHAQSFTFDNGQSIPELKIRYETYGDLNTDHSNAILVCHALSGDHHCAGYHEGARKPGWWDNMIGPGKPIDTGRFHVICPNCLGGCQGTTGPASINPESGKPYNQDFPRITIGDMVRAQKLLLNHMGIQNLYAAVGGSMGGMQVMQWMIDYPEVAKRVLILASTARQSTQAIAFDEVGRSAIHQDPNWNGGDYDPENGPDTGLAIARMMAHITYLSNRGLESKFGRSRRQEAEKLTEVEFEVESYLRHQGRSFVNRFDANTYLHFTKALDVFDLYGEGDDLTQAFKNVQARILAIGFTSDWLYSPEENRDIIQALLKLGKDASYAELEAELGHDSFLLESEEYFNLVRAFLAEAR
uniref:Homoserine O-acetyltransferase n=1 Tax=uncultured verrucomicrobium HF0500_27H16 TaxID=723600 RepID=E7C5I9_9BACT|nr:homoserine acetyltransferase [uncultured verrucomicrobium HF0500_27H16]